MGGGSPFAGLPDLPDINNFSEGNVGEKKKRLVCLDEVLCVKQQAGEPGAMPAGSFAPRVTDRRTGWPPGRRKARRSSPGRTAASGSSLFPPTALEEAIARARVTVPSDPYAARLVDGDDENHGASENCDGVSRSRYVDDSLLKALETMTFIKQVVLFGCNLDTRPYRLPVPRGSILFDVAPESVHVHKKDGLKSERTRPGSLHVQVPVPAEATIEDAEKLLARRGFQGSKPSLWALEDMGAYCTTPEDVEDVIVHVSKAMALDSLLVGSVGLARGVLEEDRLKDVLAACNLMGDCFPLTDYADSLRSPGSASKGERRAGSGVRDILFYGTQVSRSIAEKDIYQAWTQLAEEIDEDYFDNFR